MAALIEDYALIGDTGTTALVSRSGSIDWFCAPRFDSAACFAGLLGGDEHGHWSIAPQERPNEIDRSYRGDTLVLETVFNWPGVGRLIVQAVSQRDYPLVQAGVVVTASVFIFINLMVDLLYAVIDPRVRLA